MKKIDTGAPMEIGMPARTDGEEGYGKASELAMQAVYKGTGANGGGTGGKDPSWSVQKYFNSGKGEKGADRAGTDSGTRQEARKEEKGKRKVAKVTSEFAGAVGKQDTMRQFAPRGVGTRV